MKKTRKTLDYTQLLDLFEEVGVLKRTKRTGWVLKGITDAESVADHCYRTSVLALVLAKFYLDDLDKVVKMAIVHDLAEAAVGDVRWEQGAKVVGNQRMKSEQERQAVSALFKDNPDFKEYVQLWVEYEDQRTKEAQFVKQLDKLEMALQALEYEKLGALPGLLDEFWENARKYLEGKELGDFFSFIEGQRPK